MKFKLQGFGIKESQYERPNQPWICGWAATGEACRVGPDSKGQCRATYECAPIKKDARWQCTRPPLYGGPCEKGPLPSGSCSRAIPKCQPVRSLRAKRGLLVVWASVVTAGLLVSALASSHRGELLSPGDLGFQHGRAESVAPLASLLELPTPSPPPRSAPGGEKAATPTPTTTMAPAPARAAASAVGDRCSDCHVARGGAFGWLTAAFGAQRAPAQSQLCLRCHALGEHALKAHSRPTDSLAPVTARVLGAAHPAPPSGRSWECASCHHEHRGRNFPIAFMANAACQACHARTFGSLASGHPEFSGYPYKRGIHLKFDHNKHASEYFKKEKNNKEDRAFECRSCHMPDASGRNMLVRGFDQTCSLCHAEQIAQNEGIPFLSVPGFDPEGLKRGGKGRIGEWPNKDETDLSPFMRLLLMGGKDGAEYLDDLKGVDLLDLAGATDEELEAVQAYSAGVKRLFSDLSLMGHEALRQRFEKALFGADTHNPATTDLLGEISPATVHGVRRAWFPHLMDEVKRIDSGEAAPPRFLDKPAVEPNMVAQGMQPNAWLEAGGWYRNDQDFTVRYRPTRHADGFLRAWLDTAAGLRDRNKAARGILELLGKPTSPGRCLKCHSTGPVPGAMPAQAASGADGAKAGEDDEKRPALVRWTSKRPDPNERGFTKFSHTTHFSLLGQAESCSTCHLLAAAAPQAILQSPLMAQAASDFVPMQKARCLTCHVRKAAGDDCVLCHNYHVGVFATTMTTAVPARTGPSPSAAAGTGSK